jgi:alpha-beta hydrolase superfamily lysophospholipase
LAETVAEFQASDGYVWKYRQIMPDAPPRGHVVLLHGIQSHGGWYIPCAQWLAQNGWTVSLLDRRGSGLNEANRGDAPSFRRLIDDIAEFLQTLPTPRFLVGISWGGKLAVALQKRHPGLCSGMALVAPGIRAQVRPPFLRRLRIFGARFIRPRKLFPIPLSDPALFTANPERQSFIANDPLSLRDATARFLVKSRRLDHYVRRCRKHVTVPTLLLLAGRDRIIDNERTRRFVGKFAGPVEVIVYPSASHTLDFEPSRPPHWEDLTRWLSARL